MKSKYHQIKQQLLQFPKKWLITGVAGFIGSNLLETLLRLNQEVIGLDNFSTGYKSNLDEVKDFVSEDQWKNFVCIEGDIKNLDNCRACCSEVDYVLHNAAITSVPWSVDDPIFVNENNVTGFLNMLITAQAAKIKKFIYASSCAVYGDLHKSLKIEDKIGNFVSPYAITKYTNELYAKIFTKIYGLETIGLRYFNVFGKRQDFRGSEAPVIPLWFREMITDKKIFINGSREISRDFCYIDDCVQANILAACSDRKAVNCIYNIGSGKEINLYDLFKIMKELVERTCKKDNIPEPLYREFRKGDVKYFLADIEKAKQGINYLPKWSLSLGLEETAKWYINKIN